MSHTTSLKDLLVKNEAALRTAVLTLQKQGIKCTLERNAAPRMYYPDQLRRTGRKDEICDYVLRLHDGQYDVGFIKQKAGEFQPVFDTHADYLANILGVPYAAGVVPTVEARAKHAVAKFTVAYATALHKQVAARKGHQVVSTTTDAKGNTQMRIRIPA